MLRRKQRFLIIAVIALLVLSAVSAQAQLRVNVMPGNSPGKVYPYTWPGRMIAIWGNVHDGTPPYTYEWTFGDGSPSVSGTVTNPKYIAVSHTYATMGPKLATLTVTDAAMVTASDAVEIEVAPLDFEVEVNAAIEDGLRFLYLQQYADGRWHDYGCDDATTAMAVLAFENQGHLPINDYDEDIYAEYVQAGLDYLTSILRTQAIGVQAYGDPEEIVPGNADANGIGVYPGNCYPGYETGMVMMALVGAGPNGSDGPNLIAPNGPAGVVGRTYRELVVDMVDFCAWAQNEAGGGYYRGGWRYYPNYGSSDNSVSQWSPIGLEAAQTSWGIHAPDFVKTELEHWINSAQISGGSYDGAFYYTNYIARDAMPSTGAGICEMSYCGISQSDTRFQRALAYLERAWGSPYNLGFYYSMYGIAKGCRIAVDDFGDPAEVDYIGSIEWYPAYAQHLIDTQNPNGSWPTSGWGQYLDDSWALLVLQKLWIPCRPIAIIDGPASVPPDFAFDLDGSGSYIPGSGCDNHIVEWLWDFDASDGIDWNNPDAVGAVAGDVTFSLPGGVLADTFLVTLRVADDSDPAFTNTAVHEVIVNFENHPPIADAGGPYAGKIGELICFDGTGSHDPDEPKGDYVASFAWDLDGDGFFDDCYDSICCYTWSHVYSGYVGLTVTDTYGDESADTTFVTVYVSEYDVGVYADGISFSLPYPQPGDMITITADIHCDVDSDPVSDVLVKFFDGDPAISINLIGQETIPGMMPGDVIPVEMDYIVGDTVPREIFVVVDPFDDIEEYNERNNKAFREIKDIWPVALDIKPQSCPNPLNVKRTDLDEVTDGRVAKIGIDPTDGPLDRAAVFPVAILGTADFDVRGIDPSTVTLEGVPALRWSYEDVSTPMPADAGECECHTLGADGFEDLTLKFDKASIIAALGAVEDGDLIPLVIAGGLVEGALFMGSDCVLIRGDRSGALMTSSDDIHDLRFELEGNYPNPFNPTTDICFTLPEECDVTLDIYNILGQRVATLVDRRMEAGRHSVSWHSDNAASGVYFYRLTAGEFTKTKKMMLLR